jgi:hypothetical protein
MLTIDEVTAAIIMIVVIRAPTTIKITYATEYVITYLSL